MDFEQINNAIAPLDEVSMTRAQARWNDIAKPIGSLGRLEDAVIAIAGLTGSANVRLDQRAVLVMCADNGVVAEGVTQTGSDVTAVVAGNIGRGEASVCRMAKLAHADVIAVDVGINAPVANTLDRRIAPGTANMARGAAMSRAQAEAAIKVGIDLAREYQAKGYAILATGEMGIGNTTTSSAVAAVLLDKPVALVTGRGAGLSDEGLKRKRDAIIRAIAVNAPDASDTLDVLAKLGGFDIAAMAGVFIGGALCRIPVLIDGFISSVSALVAARLCPACVMAMFASHVSAEPAAQLALDALSLKPLITAGMRLGEGTGAVCALPLLDMALTIYRDMPTFSGIGIDAYQPLGGEQ